MESSIFWYIDKRVVLTRMVGDETLESMATLNKDMLTCLDEGDAPVHLLVDMTDVGNIPSNIIGMRQSLSYLTHPKLGWSIFIGNMNAMTRLVVSLTNQLSGLDVKTVHTMDEAMALLKRVDLTLTADLNA